MGKGEQPCLRLQLLSGQARMLGGRASSEPGGRQRTGPGCGQKPDMGKLQLGLLCPVCPTAGLLGRCPQGCWCSGRQEQGKSVAFCKGEAIH